MIRVFVKMILVTAGFLILCSLGVLFVRWMGLQQAFRAPPHPWMDRTTWTILKPTPEELCAAENVDKLVGDATALVVLPVQRDPRSTDDAWFVPCTPPRPLATYLASQAHADWILNVKATDTWGLDKLVQAIDANEKQKHFGILADSQKVSVYLRHKLPEALFGADRSIMLRFRVFESLWIEPAMDFWPDFVIGRYEQPMVLDDRGVRELNRRAKRVIWDETDNPLAPPFSVQGIMTRPKTP